MKSIMTTCLIVLVQNCQHQRKELNYCTSVSLDETQFFFNLVSSSKHLNFQDQTCQNLLQHYHLCQSIVEHEMTDKKNSHQA